MTLQELETNIRKGTVPALCYLYGEESFLVDRLTKKLLDAAIDSSLKDFNLNVFFGNEVKGVEVADAALTLPMFADRRAVLVKRADLMKADALDALMTYIKNPAASTCLIFNGVKIDQRKKFFQELKKQNALIEFKKMYDNKLSAFIVAEATAQGKKIESSAADLLSFLIGNNLQELSSQIEKLVVYVGNKPGITLDDVRVLASSSKTFTVFELAGFLGLKDLSRSLKSLDTLIRNGDDVPMMIGALSRHFRQLWRILELVEKRMGQADISREVGINPYFIGDYLKQAQKFTKSGLDKIFKDLYYCDLLSKTGGNSYTLMHGLIMSICTA